ncbi:MAG: cobalamin-dependent protein [Acidobacteriia bacterium]|nr:cobalamin-dependent protein [Terriglobia bacterium]
MMNNTAIFVHPYYVNNHFLGYTHHYGCSSIISHLKTRGFAAEPFLADVHCSVQQVAETLASRSPRFLGFSCYDNNFYLIRLIVAEVRRRNKDVAIVLGGPSACFSSQIILRELPEVDACVAGDGEEVVCSALEQGLRRDFLPSLPGLVTRQSLCESEIVPANLPANINNYSSPYITGEIPGAYAPRVGLISSRGCYYHCTYCNFAALSGFKVRSYDCDRLLSELSKIAYDLHGREAAIPFFDEFFTCSKPRLRQICQAIRENGLHEQLTFSCQTRIDGIDEEALDLLWSAGFRIVGFGIESASPPILRNIRKARLGKRTAEAGSAPEEEFLEATRRSVALAKRKGFHVTASIILGLPGETAEDGRLSLDFIEELQPHAYSHNFLMVFPGTELFRTSKDYGIEVKPSLTVLPFHTTAAYDTASLGYLKGMLDVGYKDRAYLVNLVLGGAGRSTFGDSLICLIKQDPGPAEPNYWSAIKPQVFPDTPFVLFQKGCNPEWYYKNFAGMVRHELPILEQYIVAERDGGLDLFVCNRGNWSPVTRAFSHHIALRPLAALENPAGAAEQTDTLYTVRQNDDWQVLEHYVSDYASGRPASIPGNFSAGKTGIEKLCRLGLGCSLRRGTGMFPDDAGSYRSLCGLCFANEKPDVGVHQLLEQVVEERTCCGCSAQPWCSQCMQLDHIASERFCHTMRTGDCIVDCARILEFAALKSQAADPGNQTIAHGRVKNLLGRSEECIALDRPIRGRANGDATHLQPGIALIRFDGQPVLYAYARREFIEISLPLAEVAEALELGAELEDMFPYFSEKYGMEEEETRSKIDQALGILGEYGLIQCALSH